jgi:hypothetical protein
MKDKAGISVVQSDKDIRFSQLNISNPLTLFFIILKFSQIPEHAFTSRSFFSFLSH